MRHRVIYAILLVAIFGGVAWVFLRPNEPVYENRPLSYWLETALEENSSVTSEQKINEVMSHIGTNAIPTLLRLLRSKDSTLRLQWFSVLKWLSENYGFKIHYTRDVERLSEGCLGFRKLGTNGLGALPGLIELYEQNISENSQVATAYSIGEIGPSAKSAVPIIIEHLTLKPDSVYLIEPLGEIHSDPNLVVPILIRYLNHRWTLARQSAANGLGAFGGEAKQAVPVLVELLNDHEITVRRAASNALLEIDPTAAAKAGVK